MQTQDFTKFLFNMIKALRLWEVYSDPGEVLVYVCKNEKKTWRDFSVLEGNVVHREKKAAPCGDFVNSIKLWKDLSHCLVLRDLILVLKKGIN